MWQKVEGLRSLKALEFEKWEGGLEPSSLTEVYAYGIRKLKSLSYRVELFP